jgi:short subunit dehydrogenase-like uncharacterized protein
MTAHAQGNGGARPFDVVVWGATGFTGRLVAEHLASLGGGFRWAMAGRSRDKLEAVRRDIAARFPDAASAPLLVGDAADPASLEAITEKTRAVVSTVGPFAKYGEPIVAACVKSRTDYCDSTGEAHFVRRIIDAHHEAAVAAGVRIVPTCGFDSIPSDLGVFALADHARREHGRALAEVRGYVTAMKGGFSGGTFASMSALVDAAREDPAVRRLLADPYSLTPDRAREIDADGRDRLLPRWDADAGGWAAPWLMAAINTRVVRRSNALLGHTYGSGFRYSESMLMPGRVAGAVMAAGAAAAFVASLGVLGSPGALRSMIEKRLPQPGEGPSREKRDAGFFKMRLYAVLEGDTQASLVCRISGSGDPGYAATSRMLGESALCLALDPRDPRFADGVLTPATAMGLRLVERLRRADIAFDITSP